MRHGLLYCCSCVKHERSKHTSKHLHVCVYLDLCNIYAQMDAVLCSLANLLDTHLCQLTLGVECFARAQVT